jgi:uncharacterized protein YggE
MSRTVTVEATGRREARPELAVVELTATGTGETAAGARAIARDRAATVRESMTAVASERVRTTEIRVEETDELFDAEPDSPYKSFEHLRVDCTPDTVESVVVEGTDARASVERVDFELHDDVRRRLHDEALSAAMDRARTKAERLADTEDLSVGDVQSVTTRESNIGMDGSSRRHWPRSARPTCNRTLPPPPRRSRSSTNSSPEPAAPLCE